MRRIYRLEHDGQPRHVLADGEEWRLVEGDVFGRYELGSRIVGTPRLLAPVTPSKIVAIGLNYKDHAAEQNKPLPAEPLMFLKPPSAVVGPEETILLPGGAGRIDYEAEVGVVIGRRARDVREQDAREYVLGITCVNDVTARELQRKDVQYTRAKGFDTFAPVGPCIAVGLDYHTSEGLAIEGWVNGERRQASTTRELIFSIDYLVAFISRVMTLLPGDIVSTGTPAGIGPLAAGDRVTVKVQGVGELTNPVGPATTRT